MVFLSSVLKLMILLNAITLFQHEQNHRSWQLLYSPLSTVVFIVGYDFQHKHMEPENLRRLKFSHSINAKSIFSGTFIPAEPKSIITQLFISLNYVTIKPV